MPRSVTRTWVPDPNGYGPRSPRKTFTYQANIPDEVADLHPPLSSATAALVVEAEAAIVALNAGSVAPADLEALARRRLRAESVASSWIEGVRLSQRKLARAELDDAVANATARAVLGNVGAMESLTASAPRSLSRATSSS